MPGEKKLLLLGGGGHCLSVLDTLLRLGWQLPKLGIVDGGRAPGTTVLDAEVVGSDDDLPRLFAAGFQYAFLAFAGIETTLIRQRLSVRLKQIGFELPVIVDPSAIVSEYAQIGEGAFIGKRAVLNTLAQIGACTVINTGAIIEHECKIGAFSHIAPGAVLCGNVTVGEGTMVGAGSCVRQGIKIGDDIMVGAGSVVTKNLFDLGGGGGVYMGNPCRLRSLG